MKFVAGDASGVIGLLLGEASETSVQILTATKPGASAAQAFGASRAPRGPSAAASIRSAAEPMQDGSAVPEIQTAASELFKLGRDIVCAEQIDAAVAGRHGLHGFN